jgi:hypothetical protein
VTTYLGNFSSRYREKVILGQPLLPITLFSKKWIAYAVSAVIYQFCGDWLNSNTDFCKSKHRFQNPSWHWTLWILYGHMIENGDLWPSLLLKQNPEDLLSTSCRRKILVHVDHANWGSVRKKHASKIDLEEHTQIQHYSRMTINRLRDPPLFFRRRDRGIWVEIEYIVVDLS